jgi:outer membrane protein assembly factor BamB
MENPRRYDYIGRGPGGNSVVEEKVMLPLKILWKSKNLNSPYVNILLTEESAITVSRTPPKNLIVNQKISSFDRNSGKVRWEVVLDNMGGGLGGRMCLYQDTVILCDSSSSSVVALKDGHICWRTEGFAACSPIRHFDGEIIIGAIGGVYFLNPATGAVVRQIEMDQGHSLSFTEEVVVVQTSGGFYNCYDRKTSELHWSRDFGELGKCDTGIGTPARGSITCRSPLIHGDCIYAGSNGRIVAFDLKNGDVLWMTKRMMQLREVLYRNGRLYGMADSCLRILEPETGEVLLEKHHPDEGGGGNMPYIAGNIIFNNEKRIQAVDVETGEMVWSFADKRKTVGFTGQPVFLDGRLYVADTAGCLYCFGHEG